MKMLKTMLFAILVAVSGVAKAAEPANFGSLGVLFSTPESVGVAGSYYPLQQLSVNGWLTLNTADIGLSAHVPVFGSERHNLVFTAMGGVVHHLVPHFGLDKTVFHAVGSGGYGYRNEWDMRLEMGVTLLEAKHGLKSGFHGHVLIGHVL